MNKGRLLVDKRGGVFGYWTVLPNEPTRMLVGKTQRWAFLCRCKCGTVKWVPNNYLVEKSMSGCGCRMKRYSSHEDRLAARRETYRRSGGSKYAAYRKVCAELGLQMRTDWGKHFAEIRAGEDTRSVAVREDYKRWWQERFTPTEIHQMARGLYA